MSYYGDLVVDMSWGTLAQVLRNWSHLEALQVEWFEDQEPDSPSDNESGQESSEDEKEEEEDDDDGEGICRCRRLKFLGFGRPGPRLYLSSR